ncbi:hypothetical protein CGRA01v4_13488 [Colletotrichum graminicola]|nr:hypothetical protein CGRA01v4_13488 [Colletotrichum graminicola]
MLPDGGSLKTQALPACERALITQTPCIFARFCTASSLLRLEMAVTCRDQTGRTRSVRKRAEEPTNGTRLGRFLVPEGGLDSKEARLGLVSDKENLGLLSGPAP